MDKAGRTLETRESMFRILRAESISLAPFARYLLATLLVATALAARLVMLPVDGGFAFITFYPAVLLSALLLGAGPALLAVALSAVLAEYILMPPFWSFALRTDQIPLLATFVLSGGLTCYLAHLLERAALRLRASNDALRSSMTSLQDSELALRDAEQRLRTITNQVPAMIGYWDRDLRCRFANAEYRAWFGVTPERALGMHMSELLGEAVFKLNQPFVRGALAGQPQHFQRSLVRHDGSHGHTDARYVPDFDASGNVRGFYVLVADITELHASYARIRALVQRLESVREEERRSVAHVLHEGISQDLFAARLTIGHLESQSKGRPPVSDACKELSAAIDKCLQDTRQVAAALHPSVLEHLGLVQALKEHATYFGGLSGLRISVSAAETFPAVDAAKGLLLFRAAQEALTNVAKHASAKAVEIVLRTVSGHLTLEISDDGIGIPDGALDKPGSLGLLGIRERLGTVGGTLIVRRNDAAGTNVTVTIPILFNAQAETLAEPYPSARI
jgi:PAS domain S-box-containing protein